MRKAFLQTSKIVGSISSLGKKDSPYRTSYWKHATVLCCMLALVLGNVLLLSAEEPHTPITIDLAISHAPRFGESATVTVTVKSTENAPGTLVEVILPAGATAKTSRWTVDLGANVPVTFKTDIVIGGSGNLSLSARALKQWGKTTAWGQMKTIPLHMDATSSAPSKFGWTVDRVPVAGQGKPGRASMLSRAPTAFSFPSKELQLNAAHLSKVSTDAGRTGASRRSHSQAAPGSITLTGTWQYGDRDGVARSIDQQVIEVRNGDGSALSSRVFCFTWIDGTYSCNLPTPPGTVRVWVRSWTNFNVSGGTNRLGVFSGTEVSNGCGSDSIDCSYPVQTPEVSCSDGSTCDVGTWLVDASTGEPWLGAHQMTQDLVRSWKKLAFDNIHGSAVNTGPGRINYPVPTGHGTHAHVGNGEVDGWISIEPPNQGSGDISTHEYGHVVMSNLWTSFSPVWPTSDCPSPHFIQRVSGPGCAYSEGWANFWAWYSNEFYDGSNNSANYGPVFNWPGGASTNMETRDSETYDSGDQVEGNIAASLGDLFDVNNDGPDPGNPDLADRVSDGVQHIWHIVSSQSGNNFSDWWNQYSSAHFPACLENDALGYNSIFYIGTGGCPPPSAPSLFSPSNGAAGVGLSPTTSWAVVSGATSYDVYFGTSSFPGFVANTGNTFYSVGTLVRGTTYFWRIVARNSSGQGPSATWSFTTAAPIASLSPGSLNFGNQRVLTISSPQSLTLSNVGTGPMNINSIVTNGDYLQSNNCGTSLGQGGSCVIHVTFRPNAMGTRTGSVAISDDAGSGAQSVPLAGVGVAPAVKLSASILNFGNRKVGTTSAPSSVILKNIGNMTLTISGFSIIGTNPGDFAQTHTCGSSLGVGASCTIKVTFHPKAKGLRKASVKIVDNAAGSPQSVALSGTGQ
jgi:HYDIN/CFA65/VesB family protein